METAVHFSSETDSWATPQDLFDALNLVFRFETDVCAIPENAKCQNFYSPQDNGLQQKWGGVCWMNPPYGREISQWVEKAYWAAKRNAATVVALLPARTDTQWWHNYCSEHEVTLLKGRLKFGDAENNAPFPSAIVVFRPRVSDAMIEERQQQAMNF